MYAAYRLDRPILPKVGGRTCVNFAIWLGISPVMELFTTLALGRMLSREEAEDPCQNLGSDAKAECRDS